MHKPNRTTLPQIKTKYFSERRAKIFLENVIQSKIVHHKGNDPDARKIMRNNEVIVESKLMEIEKGRLKGVGDLSLLSLCDIGSQFHGEAPFTAIGLTFDERLETVLASHSSLTIQSQQLIVGKDDEESVKEKIFEFVEKGRTLSEINKKAESFHGEFIHILVNVEWVKNALQSLQSENEVHNPEKEDAQLAAADGQAAAP
ncbi:hypothetical protein [Geotalea uraniireducens]|nr:hypothetical protein [Geotalea uraniireducens]